MPQVPALVLVWFTSFAPAFADVDDDDREVVREEVPSVGDAAAGDGAALATPSTPCADGVLTVSLTRREDGLPDTLLIPPFDAQASRYALTGQAWFDGKILPFELVVDGAPPWELGFPASLWVDDGQSREVTTLQLWLQPYDANGVARDVLLLEQLWLVWPDGPGAEPTLLDPLGLEARAPDGIYAFDGGPP